MNHITQSAFEAAQPRNVLTQFPPNKLKLNVTPTQKGQPVRNAFLLGDLIVLICGEASMLSASIRKMFHLCMFVNFIWRHGPETV